MRDGPVTLEELQPYVEAAITAVEWDTARARRQAGLLAEQETIEHSLPLAGQYGIEEEPLRARFLQIEVERLESLPLLARVPLSVDSYAAHFMGALLPGSKLMQCSQAIVPGARNVAQTLERLGESCCVAMSPKPPNRLG